MTFIQLGPDLVVNTDYVTHFEWRWQEEIRALGRDKPIRTTGGTTLHLRVDAADCEIALPYPIEEAKAYLEGRSVWRPDGEPAPQEAPVATPQDAPPKRTFANPAKWLVDYDPEKHPVLAKIIESHEHNGSGMCGETPSIQCLAAIDRVWGDGVQVTTCYLTHRPTEPVHRYLVKGVDGAIVAFQWVAQLDETQDDA